MSILTVNPKASNLFRNLQKLMGENNIRLWETKTNVSPSPVGDKVRFYIKTDFPGDLYIDVLNGYRLVKKGVPTMAKPVIDEIRKLIKQA